jgi:general secretion pathway protein L
MASEFTAPRAQAGWRLRLAAFWRWWMQELAQLVPQRLSALGGVASVPLVAVEGEDVVLLDSRMAGKPEARVAMAGFDREAQRAALRRALESVGETRSRVRLALDRGEALVRRVVLPAATEENLAQVVSFEMDRFTPFKASDVYFDHRVVSRDAANGQIGVEIAVARRDVVDARVEQLRAWGASVQGVTVQGETERGGAPLDLLPNEQRGQRAGGGERWLVPGLAATVLVLLFIALLYPVYNKRASVVELLPQLSKAKQEAEAADVVARQLERQVADYNFVMSRKQGTWPVLAYVEEVSRLLPDNTWVQQLDVKSVGKGREVQVTGETASSSKLIELLEQSSILQNAAPRGTVTRGSQPGAERFVIAAESKPRLPPPQRPLLEIADALPAAAPAAPVAAPAPGAAPPPPAAAAAPGPPAAQPPVADVQVTSPRAVPPAAQRGGR